MVLEKQLWRLEDHTFIPIEPPKVFDYKVAKANQEAGHAFKEGLSENSEQQQPDYTQALLFYGDALLYCQKLLELPPEQMVRYVLADKAGHEDRLEKVAMLQTELGGNIDEILARADLDDARIKKHPMLERFILNYRSQKEAMADVPF